MTIQEKPLLENKYNIEQLFEAFDAGFKQSLNSELFSIMGTDELPILFARWLKTKKHDTN